MSFYHTDSADTLNLCELLKGIECALQIWFQEDFRNTWDACPWEDDLAVCEQVALSLSQDFVYLIVRQHILDTIQSMDAY